MQIPTLIKRCLTFGLIIYPYQLDSILNKYEKYPIPDNHLNTLNKDTLSLYIEGLYLSSQEMSIDWKRGHQILKSIGFEEKSRSIGHRTFLSLSYPNQ